jgi:cytochrome c-type biogenesis protein CcsB
MNPRRTLLLLAAVLTAGPLATGSDLAPLRTIAVQDGGRVKPLDTFARELARRVSGAKPFTGGESVAGLDPAEWILSMVATPDRWKTEPMFRLAHADLRAALRLDAARDRYRFDELAGHAPFREAVGRVEERLRRDQDVHLEEIDQETLTLQETLSIVAGVFTGDSLRMVPDAHDSAAPWLSIEQLGDLPGERAESVRSAFARLVSAYRSSDRAAAAAAVAELQQRLVAVSPSGYPAESDLRLEVRYNRSKPFRWAWLLYLVSFFVLLASFPLARPVLTRAGLLLAVGGLALNTYGLIVRVLISGRAPVTNMYESIVYVAWGVVLFALVFELVQKPRYVAACATGLASLALILADNLPILNGSIEPLVPVLRDNMWLTLHVLTITLGYAAFLLAMGLGHLSLALHVFAAGRASLIKSLSRFLYRSLQAGTLLLAAGTLLGGVWASYSWGRFWGWDPKETWALIALLGYLAILHGRFLGWFRDFGMAVGSIVGFLGVLMAWYGVNYVLGTGLHSYGFGTGGLGYAIGFVAVEAALVGAALLRRPYGAGAIPAAAPQLQTTA